MKKKIPVVRIASRDELAYVDDLPEELTAAMADVAHSMREGLLAMSVSAGLAVMTEMMNAELTARIGPKHAKIPGRVANWHSSTEGPVVIGGRQLTVKRPRGRSKDGKEMTLESWEAFSAGDLLNQLTLERMLAGVATRRHGDVEPSMGDDIDAASKATGKSAVSRRFVKATEDAMAELLARDLSELDVAVLMIDGVDVAGQCVVVAMIITTDGIKVPVGIWLGDTENTTVVKSLLADIVSRGLRFEEGILCVIDGAKALRAGITRVFGDRALIQRCTLHKRRNVADHLPEEFREVTDLKLAKAFRDTDANRGLRVARGIADQLQADHPGAAASLREGLEEMFTARRLGVTDALAKTVTNTNCIESMISVARTTMHNVKRWKDGEMKKRWTAAGMLEAQRSFRRVKGYRDMPQFVTAIRASIREITGEVVTPEDYDEAAA